MTYNVFGGSLNIAELNSAADFLYSRPCDMDLVIRQCERSGHQQRLFQAFTEDVFIFSLLVYIAH